MSFFNRSLPAVTATIIGLVAAPLNAQDLGEELSEDRPEIIEQLFNCRALESDVERLACYDQAVAAVEEAEESDQLVIADREQIKKAKRGLFGFSLPRIGLFDRKNADEADEEVSEVELVVSRASRNYKGQLFMVFEDGARWRQTDNIDVLGRVEAGTVVTIKRASMGSYLAKIGKKRAFRVERVN